MPNLTIHNGPEDLTRRTEQIGFSRQVRLERLEQTVSSPVFSSCSSQWYLNSKNYKTYRCG